MTRRVNKDATKPEAAADEATRGQESRDEKAGGKGKKNKSGIRMREGEGKKKDKHAVQGECRYKEA